MLLSQLHQKKVTSRDVSSIFDLHRFCMLAVNRLQSVTRWTDSMFFFSFLAIWCHHVAAHDAAQVDYCDFSKFPSCCEHVDVFCLFETLECWLECCAQLCSDTGVSSFVFAW